MKIHEILDKRAIKIGLNATDKTGVLKELVGILSNIRNIGDQKSIVKALVERENLGSTGIGQGIAIPHGKTDKVDSLVAILGVSNQGVNFDALDGEPVYIFFLLVTPKDTSGPHLKALAQISRLLRDSYFCELIRRCKTAEEVHELIKNEEEKKH
ncbi:MAG: PTS fructose transporter subunit IIA [Candidatus Omnitrophica bacterium CG11_big_fil_rev_8_21_14_0_20_45_26]|uniref:PTS fructose transporter subunit IIA n=1 Tax=Candidatus Abzuiibacterium crystallinum TaxID=1974748 RepID=A0A2H0LPT3_9BACT|nr:MAG: PTS fructose transporter subunit IIA [Candidatus Omnitrophica bacterium CG11_big_fil_rev_8_21_14_0_20_45_26]PIW65210.1 MAG: PTS fructose transporter subunit IIA [Candidatus Omnitrophica bacterium CG12_big_fil_rev_8_21_14_0_65_45_16]